jgi:hypothetical protein
MSGAGSARSITGLGGTWPPAGSGGAAGPLSGAGPHALVGLGTDVFDVERFRRVLARTPTIADRVFTDAERAYAFFTDPVSRTNYPQYYYGRRIVKLAFERFEGSEVDRQRFFDLIYRTPHTTSTFIEAVAAASGAPFDPFSYPEA